VTVSAVVSVDGADVDEVAAAEFALGLGSRRLGPLTVVIAAYNEEGAIGSVLTRVPKVVCGLAVDTVVVVDGSHDATASVARSSGALVCDVAVNRGQGAALRLGYRLAREHGADYIATLDADGQYDPADLALVVAPLVAGDADFVSGSRRLGSTRTTDKVRALGVVVYGALISRLTGQHVTDPANGLRAMRADLTGAVELRQPQYQATELLIGAALRGFRIAEVPVTMYARTDGTTKKGGNLAYGWRVGRVIVSTWWRDRRGVTGR
jgi:glycosyltransferase involved in cell wall biosynthesis